MSGGQTYEGIAVIPMTVDTHGISDEDLELLRLLADGRPLCAVARRLNTSDRTVRRRTRAICDWLGVKTPIEAVVWAARRNLV